MYVADVLKLRGSGNIISPCFWAIFLKKYFSVEIEHTLATRGANKVGSQNILKFLNFLQLYWNLKSLKLWQLLNTDPFVAALGAQTGNQAVQMVKAGLKAIYLSGKHLFLKIRNWLLWKIVFWNKFYFWQKLFAFDSHNKPYFNMMMLNIIFIIFRMASSGWCKHSKWYVSRSISLWVLF